MPYIVNARNLEVQKERIINQLFEEHKEKGPLLDAYIENDEVVLKFATTYSTKKEFVITEIHSDLVPYLSLIGQRLQAIKPDENDEEWSLIGVDHEMMHCVGKFYTCTKLEMIDGVPALYLDNQYWYPISFYTHKNLNPKTLIGMYHKHHYNRGWIKDCYVIGKKILYKAMNDGWYFEKLDLDLFTRNEPNWLTAGSYVVLLRACSEKNPWEPSIPLNYVYRLRETASMYNFMIDLDTESSTSNGWHVSEHCETRNQYSYLKLMPATKEEIRLYEMAGGPIPINPTTNSNSVVEIQEPQEEIIKTKRLSSKNYL